MRYKLTKYLTTVVINSLILFFMVSCGNPPKQEKTALTPAKTVQAFHHKRLQTIFSEHDYSWSALDKGVPPLILTQFPNDLHLIHSIQDRKELFFKTILPMAMLANEEVSEQRNTLKALLLEYDQNGDISAAQQKWLNTLLKQYRVKKNPLLNPGSRALLFNRIDTLPESLILAQAANESGWGTSRFVRQANNIFGEWTFTPGTGLVPEGRPEGETYEVRRFSNLYQSVRSYLRNINTHRAYTLLRNTRQKKRQDNQVATGIELSHGLKFYSTRREEYSREIASMIKSNRLEQLIARTYLRSSALIPKEEKVIPPTGLLSNRTGEKERTGTL